MTYGKYSTNIREPESPTNKIFSQAVPIKLESTKEKDPSGWKTKTFLEEWAGGRAETLPRSGLSI